MTLTENAGGERFLHLLNLDDIDKDFNVYEYGKAILPRAVHLPADEALMLPLGVRFGFGTVQVATVELLRTEDEKAVFRNTEKYSVIAIQTNGTLRPAAHIIRADKTAEGYVIHTDNRLLDDEIEVGFDA